MSEMKRGSQGVENREKGSGVQGARLEDERAERGHRSVPAASLAIQGRVDTISRVRDICVHTYALVQRQERPTIYGGAVRRMVV